MLIQLGIFMASYLVLRFFVFTPFLELLALREAKTSGLREKAKAATLHAEELRAQYETRMAQERKNTAHWLDIEKRKISDEERAVIEKARHKASQEMDVSRAKVDEEAKRAEAELAPKVFEFASAMSSQILGYSVNIKSSGAKASPDKELQA